MENDIAIKKKSFLENTPFIKMALMILIVLYHSLIFMNGEWFAPAAVVRQSIPTYICQWLNSFLVFGFVFVSGYLFYYLKIEKNKYEKFGPFVLTKTKRLIVPYIFVCLVWAIPLYVAFYGWNFQDILHKFILGEGPEQLWFLLMLFLVFVIFWPLSNFFTKKYAFVVPLLFLAASYVGSHYLPNYFQVWSTLKFVFYFYLGFVFRKSLDIKFNKIPFYVWIVLDALLFVALYFVQKRSGNVMKVLSIGVDFMLCTVGCLMIWSTLQFVGSKIHWKKSKVIGFLISSSMVVYLFHQQIVYACVYLLSDKINCYAIAPINFVVALSISLLIAFVMLKFNVTRFLVGEKPIRQNEVESSNLSSNS